MKSQITDAEEGVGGTSTAAVAVEASPENQQSHRQTTTAPTGVVSVSTPSSVTKKKKEKLLTATESKRLQQNEMVIKQGLATFFEVGRALLEIRDSKLYRVQYRTFEGYCREKWGFSKSHANRLIGGAEIVETVSADNEADAPISETHVRPLIGMPAYQQRKIWKQTLAKAGGDPNRVKAKDVVAVGREMGLIKLESHGTPIKVGLQKQQASGPARANLVRRDDVLEVLEVWIKNHAASVFKKNWEAPVDELRREINDL